MEEWIRSWQGTGAQALLEEVASSFPVATAGEREGALRAVAHGEPSAASTRAAGALCQLAGLGDPSETAYRLYNESGADLTEPQWFVWIAGYSYNWVCNSGLSACYFEFGERQFDDRVRAYEAIGAERAAQVIRDADRAFGPGGPGPLLEERQALIGDALDAELDQQSRRFWECGEEIYTRCHLYALEHPDDFRQPR